LHFRVEGPVVAHLQEAFVLDWEFCTGEVLDGPAWFPRLEDRGTVLARGIADGPDLDFDKIRLTIHCGIDCAQRSIHIVTPYFLPDQTLIVALNVAAMRGVDVNIYLPQKNNLLLVQWACTAQLWQVLQRGCKVWLTPPPFDHTKIMLVDDVWSFVGSANWDPRSLRLNFEFNLECYDRELAATLREFIDRKRARSKPTRWPSRWSPLVSASATASRGWRPRTLNREHQFLTRAVCRYSFCLSWHQFRGDPVMRLPTLSRPFGSFLISSRIGKTRSDRSDSTATSEAARMPCRAAATRQPAVARRPSAVLYAEEPQQQAQLSCRPLPPRSRRARHRVASHRPAAPP
jgi:hypothetical protein